jgi:hypothetical protein
VRDGMAFRPTTSRSPVGGARPKITQLHSDDHQPETELGEVDVHEQPVDRTAMGQQGESQQSREKGGASGRRADQCRTNLHRESTTDRNLGAKVAVGRAERFSPIRLFVTPSRTIASPFTFVR